MSRKRYTPEQIIGMLRQAEVELAEGRKVPEVCRSLGISEQSYYRWRNEYGGLKVDQVKRMKELEHENTRLGDDTNLFSPGLDVLYAGDDKLHIMGRTLR